MIYMPFISMGLLVAMLILTSSLSLFKYKSTTYKIIHIPILMLGIMQIIAFPYNDISLFLAVADIILIILLFIMIRLSIELDILNYCINVEEIMEEDPNIPAWKALDIEIKRIGVMKD